MSSIVCKEVFDDFTITSEEINEYAIKIGIDPKSEPFLIPLAKEGLIQALPQDWRICYNEKSKNYYYYNEKTKVTQWDHPLDDVYRKLAEQLRQQQNSKATTPNSTISEDGSLLDSGIKSQCNDETDSNNMQDSIKNNKISILSKNNDIKSFGDLKSIKNSRFEVFRTHPQITLDMRINKSDSANNIVRTVEGGRHIETSSGFQISGTGSMFLKSNTLKNSFDENNVFKRSDIQRHLVLEYNPNVKGILRDSSLTDISKKKLDEADISEDKKSVRFNLDDIKIKSPDQHEDYSNPLDKSPEQSDNEDPWDFDDDDNDDSKNDEYEVKIPLVLQPQSLVWKPPIKPVSKVSLSVDENRTKILDKIKERSLVRPLYDETNNTDSDSRTSSILSFTNKPTKAQSQSVKDDHFESYNYDEKNNMEMIRKNFTEKYKSEENKLKEEMNKNLEKLRAELIKENNEKLNLLQDELKRKKKFQDEISLDSYQREKLEENKLILEKENERLENQIKDELLKLEENYNTKLKKSHDDYEFQFNQAKLELEKLSNENLQEFQIKIAKDNENLQNEVLTKHKTAMDILQKNHSEILEELERDLNSEIELIKKEHDVKLIAMREKLNDELESEKQKMRETGEDRLYEKVRCEKRVLEDKYRCLKEKYVRLKTDVKLSLERRNRRREQAAAAQTHQASITTTTGSETERSISNKPLSFGNQHSSQVKSYSLSASYPDHHQKPPPSTSNAFRSRDKSADRQLHQQQKKNGISSKFIKQLQAQCNDDTTSNSESKDLNSDTTTISNNYSKGKYLPVPPTILLSDNGNSDSEMAVSLNHPQIETNNNSQKDRSRKKGFSRMKSASTSILNAEAFKSDRPCTPVENLRRQLQKLEDLEDQFPDNNSYHLRYPFADNHNETSSSELEFFKHRIHLERETVRRAKDSLRSQRTNFRIRQREIKQRNKQLSTKHALDQLIQEEKEITEMEVNLHRTKSLLGEKVIRLRHLEHSLQRIYEKEKPLELLHVENKDDATLSDLSSHSSSGFSSNDFASEANIHYNRRQDMYQDSSEAIQNLEILNVEIREILDILGRQQIHETYSPNDMKWNPSSPNLISTTNKNVNNASVPSLAERLERYRHLGRVQSVLAANPRAINYTSSLVERTRDLRNWLKQAKNEHEIFLGTNFSLKIGAADSSGSGMETLSSNQMNL